jgi:hypothetical protein
MRECAWLPVIEKVEKSPALPARRGVDSLSDCRIWRNGSLGRHIELPSATVANAAHARSWQIREPTGCVGLVGIGCRG